jgi:hypothetical protein
MDTWNIILELNLENHFSKILFFLSLFVSLSLCVCVCVVFLPLPIPLSMAIYCRKDWKNPTDSSNIPKGCDLGL